MSYYQKKYWSWILKKRRKKTAELLTKKYNKAKILEDNQYLNLIITNKNVVLTFEFSNYPPYRFSVSKNRLKAYIEKSEYIGNDENFKFISINNRDWFYKNKIFKDFFINRSIENLVKNYEKEIHQLIEKSRIP